MKIAFVCADTAISAIHVVFDAKIVLWSQPTRSVIIPSCVSSRLGNINVAVFKLQLQLQLDRL